MPIRIPKPISPQVHRNFDMVALPATFGLAAWLGRRNPAAATVVLLVAAVEGTTQLTTDFTPDVTPRGPLRWISLRDHLRITSSTGVFLGLIAARMKDLRTKDRGMILGLAASAIVFAALTDSGED